MDFNLQTASKTPFGEPRTAISPLVKFAFSPEKRENTLNVSVRFLTDNKSLRKKGWIIHEGSVQKSMIKDCYSSYISIVFD